MITFFKVVLGIISFSASCITLYDFYHKKRNPVKSLSENSVIKKIYDLLCKHPWISLFFLLNIINFSFISLVSISTEEQLSFLFCITCATCAASPGTIFIVCHLTAWERLRSRIFVSLEQLKKNLHIAKKEIICDLCFLLSGFFITTAFMFVFFGTKSVTTIFGVIIFPITILFCFMAERFYKDD